MQRLKKDTSAILRELMAYFKRYPGECDAGVVSDVLESLSKRLDSDLIQQTIEYEILLGTYSTMRNFTEMKALVAEMKRKKVPITMRARLVVMKTALKMSNFDEALDCFKEHRSIWQVVPPSESTALRHLVSQLAELACKEHRLDKFLPNSRARCSQGRSCTCCL